MAWGRRAWVVALLLGSGAAADGFTTYKGHGGPIMALAVSPSGQLASASFDNSVGLWSDGAPTWLEGHAAAVTTLAWGADGRLWSGGDDFALRVWGDAAAQVGTHQNKVTSIAPLPDGTGVLTGSWDGTLRLWPDRGAPQTWPSPGSGVNAVALTPQADAAIVATSGGKLWRYERGDPVKRLPLADHGFGVNRVALGDGWVAYGAVDGVTRVVDAVTGTALADFTLERRPILAMAHHADTGQLAVGDGDGYIMMIDTQNWQITRDFRAAREGPVWALAFSLDGSVIHAGGLDDTIYAWPVALLDAYDPAIDGNQSFLRPPEEMSNGERQFMRKCSICHALDPGPSRKAGPTLHNVFGRQAGTVPGYSYSDLLASSDIIWTAQTIDALFDLGPDHYIPGSKMPMQVIAKAQDRTDLIAFLRQATSEEDTQ
ncbi:MAG: c-type cytochrome [Pseudomonadota bacterium]